MSITYIVVWRSVNGVTILTESLVDQFSHGSLIPDSVILTVLQGQIAAHAHVPSVHSWQQLVYVYDPQLHDSKCKFSNECPEPINIT
jgi:hypothetical protein